ncbi:hypothetical protein C2G38_2194042 [Gigaspora rosea]|uniref:Uncharacterized protein n=1 Tax=Gigaspora rosea TaxID=44941 RepID=A0A397V1A1_9GLOM|nr:hypothetical protein C2G38_2194042 [Gigaspora rosea]
MTPTTQTTPTMRMTPTTIKRSTEMDVTNTQEKAPTTDESGSEIGQSCDPENLTYTLDLSSQAHVEAY